MLLDGSPLRKDFERITGYVEQMDVHNGFVTVREALLFSAKLRQEFNISVQAKRDYVDKVYTKTYKKFEKSRKSDIILQKRRKIEINSRY